MATELQKQVWNKLREIPKGKVTTYGLLAAAIGKPRAVRAVASAVGKNPDLIKVPCHRVVRSDGEVGKYASGQKKKIELLKKEGVVIVNKKIDLEGCLFDF